MAKLAPFTLVRKQEWKDLSDKIASQNAEIASATAFIKEIEKGNLDSVNADNVDVSSLTGSLVTMRDKMKVIAREEKERNWVAEGLALFSEILRSHNRDLDKLADRIISELVRYMDANQGGLYLLNRTNKADVHIELVACYAYNRKKYGERRIELGEGLLGQAALEKETIFMTNVPDNYVKISSGLGEALPRNIMIVPLKIEEEVYGLVELASFLPIKKHQLDFVEKLSETLAATIAAVKTSEHTHQLLRESQMQAEQLRSQEEEMRQSMEELTSTQEEMQRIHQEVQRKEKEVSELIDASKDAIVTINRNYKIILCNKAFASVFKGRNIGKDFDYMSLFSSEEQVRRRERYSGAFEGKEVEVIDHITRDGGEEMYYRMRCIPLLDDNMGLVGSVAIFVTDITELYKAKEHAENLTREAQQQTEELKAQEEELRQNMEELQAIQDEMKRVHAEVEKNEAEVRELLDVSTDSILTLDREYKVIRFNRVFASAFSGLKVEKGMDILTMFDNEDEKNRKRKVYSQAFAGKVVESVDHVMVGDYDAYYRVTHSPLFGTDGTVTAIAIFASDISELHKAKEQAEQNENSLTELLNVSKDTILTLDRNYCLIRFNKKFSDDIPMKVEKGFDLMQIFPESERAQKKELYDQVFSGKVVELIDHTTITGKDTYHKITHAPLYDTDGGISSIALYVTDVTDLYNAKNAAEQAAKEAQQQTEELRSQEEEIRQNMEELQAIQEDMHRVHQQVARNEKEISELLNVSTDSILTLDRDYCVVRFNRVFANSFSSLNITKGFDIFTMFDKEEDRVSKKKIYNQAFAGKVVESTDHINVGGYDSYFRVTHSPLFDDEGKVTSIAVYASDITELYSAKEAAEKSARQAQQQTEGLRAQEEELRQNMEEMQAIQEELSRKNQEMEKVKLAERDRADAALASHKKNMQNLVSRFKELEAGYKNRIADLEKKLASKE